MKYMKRALLVLVLLWTLVADATPKPGGIYTSLALKVDPVTKDGKLLGVSEEKIRRMAGIVLKRYKIQVVDKPNTPFLHLKATTLDVGPQVVTYVYAELQEIGRLQRMQNRVYVITWNRGKMVASDPAKHPDMVFKAVKELTELYLKDSLR